MTQSSLFVACDCEETASDVLLVGLPMTINGMDLAALFYLWAHNH